MIIVVLFNSGHSMKMKADWNLLTLGKKKSIVFYVSYYVIAFWVSSVNILMFKITGGMVV